MMHWRPLEITPIARARRAGLGQRAGRALHDGCLRRRRPGRCAQERIMSEAANSPASRRDTGRLERRAPRRCGEAIPGRGVGSNEVEPRRVKNHTCFAIILA